MNHYVKVRLENGAAYGLELFDVGGVWKVQESELPEVIRAEIEDELIAGRFRGSILSGGRMYSWERKVNLPAGRV